MSRSRSRSSYSSLSSNSIRHRKSKHFGHRKNSRTNNDNDGFSSKSSLDKLSQKVSSMMNTMKKRNRERPKSVKLLCGCPYDCSSEIKKLKQDIADLESGLNSKFSDKPIYEISHFKNNPLQLLCETWLSIGKSKLGNLVSPNLLFICARREKRDQRIKKHSKDPCFRSCPFISFDHSDSEFGVLELWRRCLQELEELSSDDFNKIVDGSLVFNAEEHNQKMSLQIPQDELNVGSSDVKTYVADSTSNLSLVGIILK